MRIAIVTDSTGDFDPAYLKEHNILWVPNYIIFGDDVYADRIDIQPQDFYRMLKERPEFPSTSQPTIADFGPIYQQLADEGYEHIVSIHISHAISGVLSSAPMAAAESPIPVTLVDSLTTSVPLRYAVEAAVKARDNGASVEEVVAAARNAAESAGLLLMVDNLDALVRGGRAGRAQGIAAGLLNIKPIITLAEGTVSPVTKAKGRKKAIAEMVSAVAKRAESGPVEVELLEVDAGDSIKDLRRAIEEAGIDATISGVTSIGPTVAVHTGAGCIGVAFRSV